MTPEFAETVAPVVRWAKEQGWHWRNAFIAAADGNRLPFDIDVYHSMYGTHYGVQALPVKWFEPDSPQQAIDVLAALGVLPARFSSQWREGRDVALQAVASSVLLPYDLPEGVQDQPVGSR